MYPVEPGGARGTLWTFRDITVNKGLETGVARSQKLEVIGTLAGGIALGSSYRIETAFEVDLPLVKADATLLEQVVLNLCVNARDAMPGGGVIFLKTFSLVSQSEETVVVSVRDQGMGIPEEHVARIFDPFFTTKPVGKGSGLGLAMSYSVVRQYGGELSFESQQGQGTEFRIALPACGDATLVAEQPTAEHDLMGLGARVLVVDDEQVVRRVAERVLTLHGYEVISASSGEEALECLAQRPVAIDVVLLDLTMPGMGGIEALETMRKLLPHLPVVLCSGYSAEETLASLERLPEGFVRKPYSVDELLTALSEATSATLDAAGNRVSVTQVDA